jgi:DNA-directed RNA polymerase specialized sigma24 family protein
MSKESNCTDIMCDLESRLLQLVLAVKEQPAGSSQRNRYLSKLFCELQNSEQLAKCWSKCPTQLQGNYGEIYADALQRLFIFITKNIDKYDAAEGTVIQWVNGQLKWRFLDAVREWSHFNLDYPMLSVDELDRISSQLPTDLTSPSLFEQVINYIDEDPDGYFQEACTGNNPQANFRYIALKRNVDNLSWKELAEELDLKIAALSNFYQRYLERFTPLIVQYLSE